MQNLKMSTTALNHIIHKSQKNEMSYPVDILDVTFMSKYNKNDYLGTLLTVVSPQSSIHRAEPSSCDAWIQ